MISAVVILGGLGLIVGAGLAVASKTFYVYVDPKVEAVDDALPGANCGGCGFPGCSPNAEAIVAGKSSPSSCVAAGADVAEAISAIMGVSMEAREPDIALPGCTYGNKEADLKFLYDGVGDCRAATLLNGGMKVCDIGCIGLGSCERACQFDAVYIGKDGLPKVNEKKCTGCGACERVCPKHIITLSSMTRRIIREYTTDDCTTPCQRACPAGIDICEYIRQIGLGDYHRSVQIVKERNPFPTVIGRICPRPCENDCRRQYTDEPVSINALKRFAADYERETGQRIQPYKAPETGRKAAVIGGGAAGLSTAYFLARLGHAPTVLEASDKLGGLLRSAIAADRLPLDVLDWDIDGIQEMGVDARTGTLLGKDVTVEQLLSEGFEAVYLATGGWDSRLAGKKSDGPEAAPVPGTFLLLDLLKAHKRDRPFPRATHTVISGGGKLALEAARICRSRGTRKVTILFREAEDEHPAGDVDAGALKKENIALVFNAGIERLSGEANHLTAVEYMDLTDKTSEKLSAGNLFLAAGRFPQLIFVKQKMDSPEFDPASEEKEPIRWEAFETYKRPDLNMEIGLFANGDEISDFSGAIRAIGAGRRTAAAIHQTMVGIPVTLPENVANHTAVIQNVHEVHQVSSKRRNLMPMASVEEKSAAKESEKGFTVEMAKAEADRCLKCGLICYQRSGEILPAETTAAVTG